MSFKKIIYGGETMLRLEYPLTWNVDNLSAVNVAIHDRAGNELLASTAATLFTATTLEGAVTAGSYEVALNSGTDEVFPGDVLVIAQSSAPAEEIEAEYFTGSTYTVTTKRPLLYDHPDDADVYGCFALYDLDASDTDTFELGEQLVISWIPTWTDSPVEGGDTVRERAEVVAYETRVADFQQRFASTFPREYEAVTEPLDRFEDIYYEARRQLKTELALRGLDMDRIVDADLLGPVLMNKMRWIILVTADESYIDEREACMAEYNRQFELLCNSTIWVDNDQDNVLDDDELTTHDHIFDRAL